MHGILGSSGSNAKRFPATQNPRPLLYSCEDYGLDAARRLARILRRLDTERWRI